MNKLNKLVAVGFLAFAGQASALTVAGVTWDPDYLDPSGEKDFIAQFNFTQWYTSNITVDGSIPTYGNAVGINNVINPSTGAITGGYYLEGVGSWYSLNGQDPLICNNCEVTYGFGGIGLNTDGSFNIANAWAEIFVNDLTPNYSHPTSSQAEVNDVMSGISFLKLSFTSLGFTTGNVQNGQVSATFDIIGGAAADYFDPKTLDYTADAFFRPNVTALLPNGARYSEGGNGSLTGNTEDVPEPATLALIGIGLLGATRIKRKD